MQARKLATFGLTAGIVLSVSAVSLWALQIPGMDRLPDKPAALPPIQPADNQIKAAAPKVDSESVAAMGDRFDLAVVHAPKEEPKTEVVEKHEEPVGPEWSYLGPVHEATRTLAMVSVDGHQKILAEGRTFGDTKLVSVSDDAITVEIKGAPKTIERGKRDTSKSVAWVRNIQNAAPPPGVGQPQAIAAQPGNGPRGNLPPEVQARLQQRGMAPDQIQNFRQGRGGNGNGGGGPGDRSNNGRQRFGGDGGAPRGDSRPRAVPVAPADAPASDAVDIRRVN
jgi:hypothetical protein